MNKFWKSVTNQQPTHNVDTRDPTGSKNNIIYNDIEHLPSILNINKYETQLFAIFNDILDTYFL